MLDAWETAAVREHRTDSHMNASAGQLPYSCRAPAVDGMPLHYSIDTVHELVTITGEYAQPDEWRELLGRVLERSAPAPGVRLPARSP